MNRQVTRRRALAAVGGTVTLAGCLSTRSGSESPGSNTSTETDKPESDGHLTWQDVGEPYETEWGSVTVSDVDVRKAIATPNAGSQSHIDVAAANGKQFVVANVLAVGNGPPETEDLAVVEDGDVIHEVTYPWNTFESDANPQPLGFRVPVTDTQSAGIRWNRIDGRPVQWTLPDDLVDALGAEPVFEVERFEVADAVYAGEDIPVEIEVVNTGDRDGTFLAELGVAVLSDVGETSFAVPKGSSVVHETELRPAVSTPPGGGDSFPVVLDWGVDRLRRTVDIKDSGTTAPGPATETGSEGGA